MSRTVAATRFQFPGFGPELSEALAVALSDGRVVIAEAPGNPSTSLANAVEAAVAAAARLGDGATPAVFQWTPNDPLAPASMWRVQTGGEVSWEPVDWRSDPELETAVEALRRAGAG